MLQPAALPLHWPCSLTIIHCVSLRHTLLSAALALRLEPGVHRNPDIFPHTPLGDSSQTQTGLKLAQQMEGLGKALKRRKPLSVRLVALRTLSGIY